MYFSFWILKMAPFIKLCVVNSIIYMLFLICMTPFGAFSILGSTSTAPCVSFLYIIRNDIECPLILFLVCIQQFSSVLELSTSHIIVAVSFVIFTKLLKSWSKYCTWYLPLGTAMRVLFTASSDGLKTATTKLSALLLVAMGQSLYEVENLKHHSQGFFDWMPARYSLQSSI